MKKFILLASVLLLAGCAANDTKYWFGVSQIVSKPEVVKTAPRKATHSPVSTQHVVPTPQVTVPASTPQTEPTLPASPKVTVKKKRHWFRHPIKSLEEVIKGK
jgi:hypothetical protein